MTWSLRKQTRALGAYTLCDISGSLNGDWTIPTFIRHCFIGNYSGFRDENNFSLSHPGYIYIIKHALKKHNHKISLPTLPNKTTDVFTCLFFCLEFGLFKSQCVKISKCFGQLHTSLKNPAALCQGCGGSTVHSAHTRCVPRVSFSLLPVYSSPGFMAWVVNTAPQLMFVFVLGGGVSRAGEVNQGCCLRWRGSLYLAEGVLAGGERWGSEVTAIPLGSTSKARLNIIFFSFCNCETQLLGSVDSEMRNTILLNFCATGNGSILHKPVAVEMRMLLGWSDTTACLHAAKTNLVKWSPFAQCLSIVFTLKRKWDFLRIWDQLVYKRGTKAQATQLCPGSQANTWQSSEPSPCRTRPTVAAQTTGHTSLPKARLFRAEMVQLLHRISPNLSNLLARTWYHIQCQNRDCHVHAFISGLARRQNQYPLKVCL